ncbi:glycosyl hydrolase family 18 protein [Marinactinospora thermotolerans]|uniref:chitinase n=1 Tax=Marinactinospora thermotolerans DSM 45154 TaxID=1122192 RepID=A0A1T4Q752_9ACTN|nr:glycoside hydrolase family 18 chitinase [Marinactinospora thermotolerans]SJZ99592.1 chitinase family 18 [Marinactinospora thermotolerans DSM 45154]
MRSPRKRWLVAAAAALLALPTTLTAAPAAAAPSDVTVVYTEGDRWNTGYSGQFTIANASSAPLTDWTIEFTLPAGASVTSLWNATMRRSGSTYVLTPPSWGAPVPAGGSYGIGFNGAFSGGETAPVTCTINGAPCAGGAGEDDTTPPSAPSGLRATDVTSTSVTLSWNAAQDNVGVAGYEVLQGGEVVRSTVGTATTATVGGLSPDTEYSYSVRAYDAAGNRSAASTPITTRTGEQGGGPGPAAEVRVGYFTQWGIYGRDYLVQDMDRSGTAEKLTHINYAFANVSADGQCFQANQAGVGDAYADYGRSFGAADSVDGVGDTWDQALRGNFNQLRELKEKHPHLKVNISIGGWTWSRHLSDAALTDASRERVVRSCIDMYLRGNLPVIDGAGGPGSAYGIFDGIDLDWEWPGSEGHEHNTVRPEDKENFTALVQEFRDQLDALEAETGRTFELTSFMPADPEKIDAGYEVAEIMPNFDFVTVQGYDFHGGWDSATGHQSNLRLAEGDPGPRLFSSEIAVDAWIERGAKAEDLVLGVPFYGRGWRGVSAGPAGDGMFQPASGPAPGTYEAGIEDWKKLKNLQGYELYRDDAAGAAWLYNGDTLWTYDDETSMAQKADWAQERGLGGVMVWSVDGDDAQGSLMAALDQALDN